MKWNLQLPVCMWKIIPTCYYSNRNRVKWRILFKYKGVGEGGAGGQLPPTFESMLPDPPRRARPLLNSPPIFSTCSYPSEYVNTKEEGFRYTEERHIVSGIPWRFLRPFFVKWLSIATYVSIFFSLTLQDTHDTMFSPGICRPKEMIQISNSWPPPSS